VAYLLRIHGKQALVVEFWDYESVSQIDWVFVHYSNIVLILIKYDGWEFAFYDRTKKARASHVTIKTCGSIL
jgi:hypothetical protein